jgi:very-short-patch-repair endonuclease
LQGKDQKRADRARSLRRALTPAEFALWERIRARRLGGFKFVRQEPIDRYAPTPPSPARGPLAGGG